MNNYKKIRLLELLKEYDREMLRQRNVRANSIWDIVQLVQPKVQKLVSKINKLPMFTKSGIKDRKLAIYTSEIVYYKNNYASYPESEYYDNIFNFTITTKNNKLEDIYFHNLNYVQRLYSNTSDSNIKKTIDLLHKIYPIILAIYDNYWLMFGNRRQDNKFLFGLEYGLYNPSLSFGYSEKIQQYDNLDELLKNAYKTCDQIYDSFKKISNLYIKYNNQIIDLAKRNEKIEDILDGFIREQLYY